MKSGGEYFMTGHSPDTCRGGISESSERAAHLFAGHSHFSGRISVSVSVSVLNERHLRMRTSSHFGSGYLLCGFDKDGNNTGVC